MTPPDPVGPRSSTGEEGRLQAAGGVRAFGDRAEGKRGQRAALFAVTVSALLCAVKGFATWQTGSLALGAAALDSLFDLFLSAANYVVVRTSVAPPDPEHTYGHGKFESFAALTQGLVLAVGGAALIAASVGRFSGTAVPERTGLGVAVLALSALASFWVGRVLARAARRTGSPALQADSLHYTTDLWVNGAALAALVVVRWTGWVWADPLVAVVVAGAVVLTAFSLLREAFGDLTDRALPDEEVEEIARVIAAFEPEVVGFHDLRTRRGGHQRFIELHLEIPKETTFERAHDLTVAVLEALEREFPRTKVFIHTDPV